MNNNTDPSQAVPAAPTDSQQNRISNYLHAAGASKHAASVLSDLRTMDLSSEIAPLDAHTFAVIRKDFVFWAVSLLAVVPLILVTLTDMEMQLTGFLLFFAAIWGMIFKKFIIEESGGWKLPLASLFFTGIIGIRGLVFVCDYLPDSYIKMADSTNLFTMIVGCVLQTGLCEELCKIVPVLAYLLWKRSAARPLTIVLVGVFSGLGFAAFENMQYANGQIVRSAALTIEHGAAGLQAGVKGAMINVMLRSMSSVFEHAVYTGIFAYFIALAFVTGKRRVALALVGLLVAATVHGLYNAFWSIQTTLPSLITALAFMLFYAYLTKLRLVIGSQELVGEPAPGQPSLPAGTENA